jgi:hypothetical protein
MTIQGITSPVSSYASSWRAASPSQILKNIKKVALPALLMVGMYYGTQPAEAFFGAFTVCMACCTTATGGFGAPACIAACSASLALPV